MAIQKSEKTNTNQPVDVATKKKVIVVKKTTIMATIAVWSGMESSQPLSQEKWIKHWQS
jgi:hypothetical protein